MGENAAITRSVLGRGCAVGRGVSIVNCILMRNVTVGDGAVLVDSIIGDGVVIGAHCNIASNCVVGAGAKIGANKSLEAGVRITVDFPAEGGGGDDDEFSSDDGEGGEGEEEKKGAETVEKDVGKGGKGRKWVPRNDEGEAARVHMIMADAGDDDDAEEGGEEEESSDEEGGGVGLTFEQEVGCFTRACGICEESMMSLVRVHDVFATRMHQVHASSRGGAWPLLPDSHQPQVEDIVKRGVQENVKVDNIAMEVNGRKFAHDRTFGQCANVIVLSILHTLEPTESRKEAFAAVQKVVKKWKQLLNKFARTVADQKEVIITLESFVAEEQWAKHKLMMPIAKTMYDEDIVEERAVLDWVR